VEPAAQTHKEFLVCKGMHLRQYIFCSGCRQAECVSGPAGTQVRRGGGEDEEGSWKAVRSTAQVLP